MVYVYEIISPGCDLHGERWDFQDETREGADKRANGKLIDTFGFASPTRKLVTSLRFVAEYASRQAMRKAEEMADTLPAPAVMKACKRHDFRDGDVCSRCDEMRGVA